MNIVEWWNNLEPLTSEELYQSRLRLCHNKDDLTQRDLITYEKYALPTDYIINEEKFKILTEEFFKRMPFCNCRFDNKDLSFEISATTFIKYLFNTYVDDNTLVITSDSEHPNVKKERDLCKNVLILNHYSDIRAYKFSRILSEAKKYKKVFVYVIGTRNDTGEITPQSFFEQLKEQFLKNRIEHKIILDDVQGMFMIPRDYRIFDYVIGTAHAICNGFDMGILISNKYEIGKKAYNWGQEYIKSLDIVLKRWNKVSLFRQVLNGYYNSYIKNKEVLAKEPVAPFIFHLKTQPYYLSDNILQKLSEINLLVSNPNISENTFIQLRSHWFIKDQHLLLKCIAIIDYLLKNSKNFDENHILKLIEEK